MAEDEDLEKTADEILREQAIKERGERLATERAKVLELAKYKAAAYDRLSTATIAVGFLTPVSTMIMKTSTLNLNVELGMILICCLVAAFILNREGREALEQGYEL